MEVADRRLAHRLDRGRRQAVQAGAVLVQAGRHVVGVDARHEQRHRPHELMLGPPGDGVGEPACPFRKQGGRGHAPLELARDQARVAPQVGAVLQHGNAAIAAGQRRQVGLGQDRRLLDAPPRQALEAQHQPRLLGEVREVVVVQDEVAHPAGELLEVVARQSIEDLVVARDAKPVVEPLGAFVGRVGRPVDAAVVLLDGDARHRHQQGAADAEAARLLGHVEVLQEQLPLVGAAEQDRRQGRQARARRRRARRAGRRAGARRRASAVAPFPTRRRADRASRSAPACRTAGGPGRPDRPRRRDGR